VTRILAIGCGGFVGAVLRYWISGWAYSLGHGGSPTGTLVVNVAGATVLRGIEGYGADCGSLMALEKVESIRYRPVQ
jgi:CrcB protein